MDDKVSDRLSELPESLILEILSFLKMRDVVRTSLLSKHWKYLWLPCLRFDRFNNCPVRTFINRVLMLWKGVKIRGFEIDFRDGFESSLFGDMDLWLLFAKQRNVENLILRLPVKSEYWLPQSLCECSSITKLYLIQGNLRIRENVQWHQLKNLHMAGVNATEDVINKVVSGSPLLETFDLVFFEGFRNVSIQTSILRKLCLYSFYHGPSNSTELTICTPNLRSLITGGALFSKCVLRNVSSLTEVQLDFYYMNAEDRDTIDKILSTIQHVETLTLSAYCFEGLGVVKRVLLMISGRPSEPNKIVGLLIKFPRLKALVIDWKLDDDGQDITDDPSLFVAETSILSLLMTVKIVWYSYEASICQFVEHLLQHAPVVEKIMMLKQGSMVIESEATQKVASLQDPFQL